MNPMDLKRGIEMRHRHGGGRTQDRWPSPAPARRRLPMWRRSRPTTTAPLATCWPARSTRSGVRARSRSRTAPAWSACSTWWRACSLTAAFCRPTSSTMPSAKARCWKTWRFCCATGRLSSLKDLLPLLEEIVKAGRPLLVIAEEVDNDSLAALVINTIRGTLKTCAVKAPGFGDRRKAMVQDIAVLTGGTRRQRRSRADAGQGQAVGPGARHAGRNHQGNHHADRRRRQAQGDQGTHRHHPQGTRAGQQRLRPRKARRARRQAGRRCGPDQGRRRH